MTTELKTVSGDAVLIDDEDVSRLQGLRLYSCRAMRGGMRRTISVRTYSPETGAKKPLTSYILDVPKGMVVDHISGDPLDNRKLNLRICTVQENGRNVRRPFTAKLPFKGIRYCGGNRRLWQAVIRIDGKIVCLGSFPRPEQAHQAYCVAAQERYGQFARFD